MTVHDYCPHCGAPVVEASAEDALSHTETRLVDALRAKPGTWVTTEWLVDQVYWNDRDGGPLSGSKAIHIHVHNVRKKLGSGFIVSRLGKGTGGYMWVGSETNSEKNNGKARTQEKSRSPSTERATA